MMHVNKLHIFRFIYDHANDHCNVTCSFLKPLRISRLKPAVDPDHRVDCIR